MDSVTQLDSLLTDQPDHCLRPHQRQDLEEEAKNLRGTLDLPDSIAGAAKGAARQRYGQVTKMLRDQAPKPIEEPMRRDQVAKLTDEVLHGTIIPSMLTKAEMRRNPSGAVGEYMRRENSAPVQHAIRTWKKARFALEPDTPYDDHALVEKYRPEGLPWTGAASYMANAQIPGQFAMTPAAKANWPLPAPENTAVEQVKRRERRQMSPAQKAALAAGRAKKAAIQAEALAAVGAPTEEPA